MVVSPELIAQRVLPVGPREPPSGGFLEQDPAVGRRIPQVKRIAGSLDRQIGAADAYAVAAFNDVGELGCRPLRADHRVSWRGPLLVKPPMSRHPGMADHVGPQWSQHQV